MEVGYPPGEDRRPTFAGMKLTGDDMELKKSLCSLIAALILVPATLYAGESVRIGEGAELTKTFLVSADSTVGSSQVTSISGAKAVFPEPRFEFEPELEGKEVIHSYLLINEGSAELKILEVKTG